MTPLKRWAAEAPVYTYLPVALGNGAEVSRYVVRCYKCDSDINPDHSRGDVILHSGAARFRSVDLCSNCRTITYSMALAIPRKDGGYTIEYPASYPVRVPWPEDVADWEAIPKQDVSSMPGGWIEIADRLCGYGVKNGD